MAVGRSMAEAPREQQIGYRAWNVWFWPIFWLLILLARGAVGGDHAGPMIFWVMGIGLLTVNAILVALRSRHGLTLAQDGITWHKYGMFLPWSNVPAVEQAGSGRRTRLVVRVAAPDQALEAVARPARLEIRMNLRRFGVPIALRADRLALPATDVVDGAGRLRDAYVAAGGFKHVAARRARPDRVRARRAANAGTMLASAGMGMLLLAAALAGTGTGATNRNLSFAFRRLGGPGYMDQVLAITNRGYSAMAPTLTLVPLDRAGHRIPDVTVRTAFGSDRGMVVIPPRSVGQDVLAFAGPRSRQVADVEVIARRTARVLMPTEAVAEPHASRTLRGDQVEPLDDFDALVVRNPSRVSVAVRLVCIIWDRPSPGTAQQMLDSVPVGGLTRVAPWGEASVRVTGSLRARARECGSVKAYYSV